MDHMHAHHAHGAGERMSQTGGMPVVFNSEFRMTLFFDWWYSESAAAFFIQLVFLFALCVGQEWLYYYRTSPGGKEEGASLLTPMLPSSYRTPRFSKRILDVILYAGNLATSYFLMLAVMSLNTWVFLTVISGLSVGHFMYKGVRPTEIRGDSSEICHVDGG
ncbi:copper transporter family [Micromonas pusilla CCMP1545]|jgi:solute carrier family 31 (copper transporter), member 1|uniref:Copper transport protein n=1 Tax=Micromonas pusilla (strain CCMP1545) TaxID=564608 RepID=C1MHJ3_MICPC|nr:copper transporter family [Micromonas pusilla CCMP1545]EEH60755.1 copper transporter family [Micromonas pusilla CCMP1545]|eukprot:XP_003055503.1 copper transporter family [Micromonas pusilla CCMP1545]